MDFKPHLEGVCWICGAKDGEPHVRECLPKQPTNNSSAREAIRAFTRIVDNKNEASGNVFYRWNETRKVIEEELIALYHELGRN